MKTPLLRLVLVCASLSPLPVSLHAQAVSANPNLNSDGNDQLVKLDTFTINTTRDQGYVAVDSLAGGRVNTPIRVTPSAMSSLTRTFIDDVRATNVRDLLQWTVNVVPADWTAGKRSPFNAWDYNFRGAGQSLQGGAGPTRNYFTFYQPADSYNIERVEFDRGPNSILFGIAPIGGVVSTYTKVPRTDRSFSSPTLLLDNNGTVRFEFDGNYVASSRLALRINLLDDHNRGWREGDKNDQRAADLALLFKPADATTIRLELEGSKARRTILPDTFSESVSLWDQKTVASTWGQTLDTSDPQATAGAPGVRTMNPWGGPVYELIVAGQPNLGLQDWAKGYSSAGSNLPVAPSPQFYPSAMQLPWQPNPHPDPSRIPALPSRDFTIGAADGVSKPEYGDATLWITQRLSEHLDLGVQGYGYWDDTLAQNYEPISFYAIDLNRQLPNGQPNPNFGQPYGDFFLSRQRQKRSVLEGRIQLTYHVLTELFGIPVNQMFSLAGGDQRITWRARQYNAQIQNGLPGDWSQNLVWARIYANDPHPSIDLPSEMDGKRIAYAPVPFDWFDFDEVYKIRNIAAVSHTRLWDDRASILLGARRDTYQHTKRGANSGSFDADAADGNTYSAGAVYYFLPWLGAFANYSKNFDPIGPGKFPDLNGHPLGPARGEGADFGFRVSTKDGKYYASFSRYDTQSKDRITNQKIGFNDIWTKYYAATGTTPDDAKTHLNYDDTEALKAKGYEFEITANPLSNLRLQASYARPEATIIEAMAGQRAYLAANLPTWSAAANGTSSDATSLRTALASAQTLLDANAAGKKRIGTVRYTANIFALYTFTNDTLRGFSIGAGVAQSGHEYRGEVNHTPVYGSARRTTKLVLAYDTKFGKVAARFALNVDNVFDNRDPYITGYDASWATPDGSPVVNGYNLPEPRTFRLTTTLTF